MDILDEKVVSQAHSRLKAKVPVFEFKILNHEVHQWQYGSFRKHLADDCPVHSMAGLQKDTHFVPSKKCTL